MKWTGDDISERIAELTGLASRLAHEINNPLAALLANLELAQRDLRQLPAETPRLAELEAELDDAVDAALRVRQIVRDLRVFSPGMEDPPRVIDLQVPLDAALRRAWSEVRARATIERDFRPTPPVRASESQIFRVFHQLALNAAEAMVEGDGHVLRVSTHVDDDGRAVVTFLDTGGGIDPSVLDHLFHPFVTTKSAAEGAGLGLSYCHAVVRSLRGLIEVESRPGAGARFTVRLPGSSEPVTAEAEDEPPVTPCAGRRGALLVIDDDLAVGIAVRRALEAEHDITLLTDPLEAVATIRRGARFDVVLCDLMMPSLTGMGLYAILAAEVPEQAGRVVFLTGGAFTEEARAFLETVGNPRLMKPFDLRSLRDIVATRLA